MHKSLFVLTNVIDVFVCKHAGLPIYFQCLCYSMFVIAGNLLVSDAVQQNNNTHNTSSCQYNCSNDFYCREGLVCVPSCNWKEIPKDSSDVTDILISLLLAASVIVGIIVLIISCIRRKRM